jgi:hypothetical protein
MASRRNYKNLAASGPYQWLENELYGFQNV